MFTINSINFWKPDSVENYGDAFLLEFDGKFGMIDSGGTTKPKQVPWSTTGTKPEQVDNIGKVCEFLRSKGVNGDNLEFAIITHFHYDHSMEFAEMVKEFKPKVIYGHVPDEFTKNDYLTGSPDAGTYWATNIYKDRVLEAVKSIGKELTKPLDNQFYEYGQLKFKFLNVNNLNSEFAKEDYNAGSLAIYMEYGANNFLFSGDTMPSTMDVSEIAKIGKPVDVVFMGHHGHKSNTNESMVKKYSTKIALATKITVHNSNFRTTHFNSLRLYYYHKAQVGLPNLNNPATVVSSDGTTAHVAGGSTYAPINEWINFDGDDWGFYNAKSQLVTGSWQRIVLEGTKNYFWYFFGKDSKMVRGWFKSTDGKWYYFQDRSESVYGGKSYPDGAMYTNTWKKDKNYWYWLKDSGVMAHSETLTINGKSYKFDASGKCLNP